VKATFVGLPFTLFPRDIYEKLSFKPYKYIVDRLPGFLVKRGIMFDAQVSIELMNMNIPLIIDKRLFLMHYGDTRKYVNLKGKKCSYRVIRYSTS